jgi:hypothetical protein
MATIRHLQNVSNLFGDILERYTGVREAPDDGKESGFSLACDELIRLLETQREEIFDDLQPNLHGIDNQSIVDVSLVIPVVQRTIEKAIMRNTGTISRPQTERMAHFAPIGSAAICLLAHRMAGGKHPDIFESNRENVVLCGSLMARYPAPISANFRQLVAGNVDSFRKSDDITGDFRHFCARMITNAATLNPLMVEKMQRFDSCPAKKNVGMFCGLTFDLHARCYRHVWERIEARSDMM